MRILKDDANVKEKIAVCRYRHHNTYCGVLSFIAINKKGWLKPAFLKLIF